MARKWRMASGGLNAELTFGTCTPRPLSDVTKKQKSAQSNGQTVYNGFDGVYFYVESELLLLRVETRDERKGTQHACQWQAGMVVGRLHYGVMATSKCLRDGVHHHLVVHRGADVPLRAPEQE